MQPLQVVGCVRTASLRQMQRLNHTAFDIAVASQGRLPATTQDSLPAAGPAQPDGIGYPRGFKVPALVSTNHSTAATVERALEDAARL
jgi:hypothetical protein